MSTARLKRQVQWLLPAIILLAVGCIKTEQQGDTTIYAFETWVGVVTIVVLTAFFILGVCMRAADNIYFVLFLRLGCPIFLAMSIPILFMDDLRVSPDGLVEKGGLWHRRKVEDVRFKDVRKLEKITERTIGANGKASYSTHLIFYKKDGSIQKIGWGDIMKGGAGDQIIQFVINRRIPFEDKT